MQIIHADAVSRPDDLPHGPLNEPRVEPSPRSIEGRLEAETASNPLAINMTETTGEVAVQTVIPAVDPVDIDVQIEGNRLTIAADVLDDYRSDDTLVHLNELIHGRYERSVRIPTDVDTNRIEAEYDNGLLTITFPESHSGMIKRIAESVKDAVSGDKHNSSISVRRK